MATWVASPTAATGIQVVTQPFGQILPGLTPIYNSAPLWIPAPGAFSLINLTTGVAV